MKRLVDALAPGQRVFVNGFSGESALLLQELAADPERAAGVTFCAVQFPGIDRADYLGMHPQARLEAHFMSEPVRRALDESRAASAGSADREGSASRVDLLALDYLGIVRHLTEGPAHDVAIAHLTPPDAQGYCSAGVAADFMPIVWPRAGKRIAHLNPRLPRTAGSFRVHLSELDAAIEADAPITPYAEPRAGDVEARIGAQVAALVRDGDTLQFGIGSVPPALAGALTSHRRLRFHGGMATPGVRALWEAGALQRDARVTAGLLLGDEAFYAGAADWPPLWLTDVRHTHDPVALARVARFVAINSAVEVDLFGQVNAERAAGKLQAGTGGLPAFAAAALASPGGRLLICLPATARGGSVSRIVPALGSEALCTVPRHLADAVVTEFGVAELRGRSLDGRAEALIGISAPAHRAALAEAWAALRRRA